MDVQPRKLMAEQYKVMTNFAELVMRQLEKDHHLRMQQQVCVHRAAALLASGEAAILAACQQCPNQASTALPSMFVLLRSWISGVSEVTKPSSCT